MNLNLIFSRSAKLCSSTRALTLGAMLIALNVVLSSVRIQVTPELRLSIGFITQAASGMLLGPVMAMLTGAASDVLSFICFPVGGSYFPGYTLTAVAGGAIFGIMLFEKPQIGLTRSILTKALVSLVCNIGLNTLWISLIQGQGMLALLPVRLLKNALLLPLEALMIFMVSQAVQQIVNRTGWKVK